MSTPREQERALARRLRLRAAPAPPVRLSPRAVAVAGGLAAAALAGVVGWALSDARPAPRPAAEPAPPPASLPEALRRPPDHRRPNQVPVLGPPWAGAPPVASQGPAPSAPAPADPEADLLRRARESRLFGAEAPRPPRAPVTSLASTDPAEPTGVLRAGTVLRAALMTAVRSDVPGPVIAQVIAEAADPDGGPPLVPQGARLVGTYAPLAHGQARLSILWTRLLLPDGRNVPLAAAPTTDPKGRAGVAGHVQRRWGQMLAASLVSLGLSAAGELGGSNDDDLARALRRGLSDTAARAGGQATGRVLQLAPVIRIPAGTEVRAVLLEDAVMTPGRAR